MKAVRETKYISFDNKEFATREECEAYETEHFQKQFCNLKPATVAALLDPQTEKEQTLADAFEKFATQIRKARIARGDIRRKMKDAGDEGAEGDTDPDFNEDDDENEAA